MYSAHLTTVTVTENPVPSSTHDALLIGRIIAMRESMQRHKERALAMWSAHAPMNAEMGERMAVGKFTQQLAQCE